MGTLNGEKSNNYIRPEGELLGRREACYYSLFCLFFFSLHPQILSWRGNLRIEKNEVEGDEAYS